MNEFRDNNNYKKLLIYYTIILLNENIIFHIFSNYKMHTHLDKQRCKDSESRYI